jgi:hypothetical protein
MPSIPSSERDIKPLLQKAQDDVRDSIQPNKKVEKMNFNLKSDFGENIQDKLKSTMIFFGEKSNASKFTGEASSVTAVSASRREFYPKSSTNQNHYRVATFRDNYNFRGQSSKNSNPLSHRHMSQGIVVNPLAVKNGKIDTKCKPAPIPTLNLPVLKKDCQTISKPDLKRSFGSSIRTDGFDSSRISVHHSHKLSKSNVNQFKVNELSPNMKEHTRIQALKELFDNQVSANISKIMLDREAESKIVTIPSQSHLKKLAPAYKRDQ